MTSVCWRRRLTRHPKMLLRVSRCRLHTNRPISAARALTKFVLDVQPMAMMGSSSAKRSELTRNLSAKSHPWVLPHLQTAQLLRIYHSVKATSVPLPRATTFCSATNRVPARAASTPTNTARLDTLGHVRKRCMVMLQNIFCWVGPSTCRGTIWAVHCRGC